MSNYGTPQSGGLTALAPGESMYLFGSAAAGETPGAPQASIPFARAISASQSDQGTTFQAFFPGTASVQIQGANVNTDASYTNVGTPITATGGSYTDTQRFAFYRANVTALAGGTLTVLAQR